MLPGEDAQHTALNLSRVEQLQRWKQGQICYVSLESKHCRNTKASAACACCVAVCLCNGCVQIKAGQWHGPQGKSHHVTQYHDVMGENLGAWARRVVQVVVVISLFGTNVSQVVASSSDAYYLDHGLNKR